MTETMLIETFMGVAIRLESTGPISGVASLGYFRWADNRGLWTCWETERGS